MTKVDCVPAFVSRSGGIIVFLGYATHLPGEPIEWDAKERLFVSPAHGEVYTAHGEPAGGPAQLPLERCPASIKDGHLVLDVPEPAESETFQESCRPPAGPGDLVIGVDEVEGLDPGG